MPTLKLTIRKNIYLHCDCGTDRKFPLVTENQNVNSSQSLFSTFVLAEPALQYKDLQKKKKFFKENKAKKKQPINK